MNFTSKVTFRVLYFSTLLASMTATTQAEAIVVVWDGGQEPTPYGVYNDSAYDAYAIIFPHNSASDAYTDNGWTAQIVTRAEWESDSFTFTDPNGWTPPAPSSIDWDTAFPAPFPEGHSKVVAYWLGAGSASPILAGGTSLEGFWTDVNPDGEWPGIGLDIDGNSIPAFVSSIPLPPAIWLFGSGLLGLVGMTRNKKA